MKLIPWERIEPGGLPGLQIQWDAVILRPVSSILTRSRHFGRSIPQKPSKRQGLCALLGFCFWRQATGRFSSLWAGTKCDRLEL